MFRDIQYLLKYYNLKYELGLDKNELDIHNAHLKTQGRFKENKGIVRGYIFDSRANHQNTVLKTLLYLYLGILNE